ncbi:zinc knuckle [Fusarium longipes]|uniref:Zinc knuckle n=1 Tax=Fusarium longipes TaxID=694270 RepID=A0A395RW12_9HYPO|nr:zinc knuckle [Fusarium longipes]
MVLKPGRKAHDPKSWRPISLLSTPSKLLERALAQAMLAALKAVDFDSLEQFEKIPARQFGMKTTTQALQFLLDTVYSALFRGKRVTILGLDMSGAYNGVFRDFLIQEMYRKSFDPQVIEFIRSLLSDRTANFRMPGLLSGTFGLNTGIPQGSPLSPLLFFIYSAVMLEHLDIKPRGGKVMSTAFAFVDDFYLISVSDSYKDNCEELKRLHGVTVPNIEELGDHELQEYRGTIIGIGNAIDMEFEPLKYYLMHFCKSYHGRPMGHDMVPSIPGFEKSPTDSMTILGVEVSCDLSWNNHINAIITKVRKRMGHLSRLSGRTWGPTVKTMRDLFLTKIRPVFTYACGAWFIRKSRHEGMIAKQITNGQMENLEKTHNFCLRQMSGAFGTTGGEILEKEFFIPNIWTVLHTQANVQRARSFLATDQRWRPSRITRAVRKCYVGLRKTTPRNPYIDLDLDACRFIFNARIALENRFINQRKPGEDKEYWADPKKRDKTVTNFIKMSALEDCRTRWNDYVLGRSIRKMGASIDMKPPVLPPALKEPWGKNSLGYYNNMSRAHSTILLHCRTEAIGLKAHVSKVCSKKDKELVKSPFCDCSSAHRRYRQTPFHLFTECSRLSAARQLLWHKTRHLCYEDLLTRNSKLAADWALQYFDIEAFDSARSKHKSTMFPPIEGIIPERPTQGDAEYDAMFTVHLRRRMLMGGSNDAAARSAGGKTWSSPGDSFARSARTNNISAGQRHSPRNANTSSQSSSSPVSQRPARGTGSRRGSARRNLPRR